MSPARFNQEPKMINGSRPTPLKINKESHLINKHPHYVSKPPPPPPQQQRTQPVIIYTHSPKVIHTQARDFMALVQKLTGLSQSTNDEETQAPTKSNAIISAVYNDDNKSSSVQNFRSYGGDDEGIGSALADHNNNSNPYLTDIPLFTPTATDFFCSPKPLYRYTDNSSFASPNLTSPSLLEFLKGLPEY